MNHLISLILQIQESIIFFIINITFTIKKLVSLQ